MKHKLLKFQEDNKFSNKEMAKLFGLKGTNPMVTYLRWRNCQRLPHPKLMKVITEKTNNLLTPNDFYEAWYEKHKF
jgi:hypothetical protein